MNFNTIVSLALSHTTLSIASPYPHPVPETVQNVARGFVYTPRNVGQQVNGVVTITKTKEEQLAEMLRGQEIQLTKLVQE
ncbi:hypothetical protein DSL72_007619 [Monilinia vaccinii-corymbosi]|uniref:Uncharacterized protein n=1 Tax=Monilinia vaccinii-corymbosi TaxID=61207 RepID=A0A8A3PIE8_9HELO|nr:hypothetical protein DSL72_007619 [Monilinia vaccinii-corymbosi]